MPQFTSSQGAIAYTDTRTGDPALILMHGLPTSKELWSPVVRYLSPNYRIVAFDLNDYGKSEKIKRSGRIAHISHKTRADVLDELRAHLGLASFVLVAHDLGASVAVDYMGEYADRVDKLILLSPPAYPDFVEPFIVKLTRAPVIGEILVALARPWLLRSGVRRGLVHKQNLTPDIFAAFNSAFAGRDGRAALLRNLRWGRPHDVFRNYPQIIATLSCPTLIIQGARDPYIPLDQATRLRNTIPGAQLTIIDDGAHFLPIDTPDKVAQEINAFV